MVVTTLKVAAGKGLLPEESFRLTPLLLFLRRGVRPRDTSGEPAVEDGVLVAVVNAWGLWALTWAAHERHPDLEKEDPALKAKALDRWYVPDPSKQAERERIREKALLKEFAEYRVAKKKLKEFRLEAVRTGFKAAFAAGDYQTILDVGAKLPDAVLQEDETLFMYDDVARTRLSKD